MATSGSNLTYVTLIEGAAGWGSADYQNVIVLQSHGHAGVLSCTLTTAPAASSPMISTENAITATSPGDQIHKGPRRSRLGIKTPDPVSLITRGDEGTSKGGQSSSYGLIGSLDEITCMIQTKRKKKVKVKKF